MSLSLLELPAAATNKIPAFAARMIALCRRGL